MYRRFNNEPFNVINNKAPGMVTSMNNTNNGGLRYIIDTATNIHYKPNTAIKRVNTQQSKILNTKQNNEIKSLLNNSLQFKLDDITSHVLRNGPIIQAINREPDVTPGNLVSVILRNGLGNRIFQILAGIGYAALYKRKFVICRTLIQTGMKSHERNLDSAIIRFFPSLTIVNEIQGYTTIREQTEMNYSQLTNPICNVVLQGYFQDERYFPSSALIPNIRTAYYENTYFVHIRAGDYLDPGSFGLDLVSYHKECFSLLGDVKYIVFSNDNTYADKYMKQFDIKYTISDKVDPVESLVEMANCAGGICANSTFSWLGAFFQGDKRGKVFMPSIWLKGRDCRGVYPKWATIVKVNEESPIAISMTMPMNMPMAMPMAMRMALRMEEPVDFTKPVTTPEYSGISLHTALRMAEPLVMPTTANMNQYKISDIPGGIQMDPNKDSYELSDLNIINIPSGRRLNYNACIVANRMFFRTVQNVGDDELYTCIMDNFNCVPDTMRRINVVSSYNNLHVEDPRAILHKGNWFVCYTDGYNVGIAKLGADCNTIYSHYLYKPDTIRFEGGDGREKNWIPISVGDNIHIWYSDNPRTILVYEDMGDKLEYKRFIKTNQRVKSNFGNIRGGCPPIPYDEETMIWFFHTYYEHRYRIGAYLTRGLDIISITPKPILSGQSIIFPCGAIQYNGDFYISMGIQDRNIGILKVSRELTFIPV